MTRTSRSATASPKPKPKKVSKQELARIPADPAEASPSRQACSECGLFARCRTPFIPAYVPPGWTGRLLVVGEGPGRNEDSQGRPFCGKAGEFLFQVLASVGITERDVALTNAVRCRPPGNATPTLSNIRCCRPFVLWDILNLRPKWVLAVGDSAARALWNSGQVQVKRLRQRAWKASDVLRCDDADGILVAVTYHPASVFYGEGHVYKQFIRDDLTWLTQFRGYAPEPDNSEPPLEGALGLDIEWDTTYRLLTVGKAGLTSAVVTETPEQWTAWLRDISNSQKPIRIVGHSIFQDLSIMRANGLPLNSKYITGEAVLDTILLSRLADENRGAYDLESLTTTLCGVAPWKLTSDSMLSPGRTAKTVRDFSQLPADIRQARCRLDAWGCRQLAEKLLPGLEPKLVGFLHRLAAVLRRVEMAGVKISRERYEALRKILEHEVHQRAEALQQLAARYGVPDLAPSNDHHFRQLLYDRLGAPVIERTDDGPAVDVKTLTLLYQDASPEIREVILARLRHRKAFKLYTTNIGHVNDTGTATGLLRYLTPEFFIHQHINPLGARTGRRSSTAPNLQNWKSQMRAMVVSRYPDGVIIKGDESQLEPRILAVVAGIDEWLELFHHGRNLYEHVARRLWGKEITKSNDPVLYKVTKETVLGTNYGMEAELFSRQLSIKLDLHLSVDEAADILKRYYRLYPQLPRYFARQKERLLHYQVVYTLTGQARRLPCPDGERTPGFKHLWNQAVNFPIQGTAAYITGAALIDLEQELCREAGVTIEEHYDNLVRHWLGQIRKKCLTTDPNRDILLEGIGKDSFDAGDPTGHGVGRELDYPVIINEVHDEIVVDAPAKDSTWASELVRATMREVPMLRALWPITKQIPLDVEVKSGPSWAGY